MFRSQQKISLSDFQKSIIKNRKIVFSLLLFGFLMTGLMLTYSVSVHNLTAESEKLNQKSRAKVLLQKIENYTAIASQIGRSVQIFLSHENLNQKDIENFLKESVQSSPKEIIYGIGASFQPFKFKSTQKFFGPYVHRKTNNPDQFELTYKFSTQAYNYPERIWYKEGLVAAKIGVYVEPYFEIDLVYVTLSLPFYDSKGGLIGVVCVDMVLPQLQSIVDETHKNGQENIHIQSRAGFLLAHPLKDHFFEKNKKYKSKQLIDFKIEDFKKGIPDQNRFRNIMTYQESIVDLGWSVVVETPKDAIFMKSMTVFWALFLTTSFLWLGIFLTIYFCAKTDITKVLNAEKTLSHQMQLLNNSRLATLGEFSSGLGHEINNPLTIVYGKTDLLITKVENNSIESSAIIKELKTIRQNAERINKIIRGLRTFSRDGEKDPFIRVGVSDIFVDTFALSSERIKSKSIKFENIESFKAIVSCRPSQISQVLLNLLNNSIDAIESQVSPWITVEVRKADQNKNEVWIIVTDSGPGIDKNIVEKIMNPFFTTKDVGRGTGLGLSISYGIMKDHRGDLYYNSEFKNTQFVMTLPIATEV